MKRSNGFRKKNVDYLIGQQYGRLTITGQSPLAGRIQCRCECGTFTEPIMAKVISGHTLSCGCLKAENFIAYWNERAEKIPLLVRRAVFSRIAAGLYDHRVAVEFAMDRAMVGAIGRIQADWLIREYGDRVQSAHSSACDLYAGEVAFLRKHRNRGPNIPLPEMTLAELEEACPGLIDAVKAEMERKAELKKAA